MSFIQRLRLIAGGLVAIAMTVVLTLVIEHKIVHGDAPAVAATGNAAPMLAMLHSGANAVYCYNTGASTVDDSGTPIDYQVTSTSNPISITIKSGGLPQNTITITNAKLVYSNSTALTVFNDSTCPSS